MDANDKYTTDDYEAIDEIYNDILHHYVESRTPSPSATTQDINGIFNINNNSMPTSSNPELPANVDVVDIWVPLGRQLE